MVLYGGGTGNPFFTTDTAAALRAAEIGADVLLKGTKVDGVYTANPVTDPSAVRYRRVTYGEALERRLRIMDAAAFALCQDAGIPIVVFDFARRGSLKDVLRGLDVGTRVTG